jgi:DNA polymerase III subunit delta
LIAPIGTVRKQIKAGTTDPVYLLVGDDDVEKSAVAAEFAETVEEELRAFNVERIHAGELTTGDKLADGIAELVAAARTLPMMSPRRVVTVMQAEMLLAPRREGEAAARALSRLEEYLASPEPQTTLVFVAGTLDRRSRMYKLLVKHATVVECGALADQADAERWIRNRVTAAGMEIEPAAARMLAERAGTDVRRLRGEVDRLVLYALGQPRITRDDAREVAGPEALQDDWAMTNAIEAAQAPDALRQLALMLDAGAPPEKVLGQLGWLVRTKFPAIAPQSVRPAVEAVFWTDAALKRSAADPRILLERLVVELCARKRAAGPGGSPSR